MGLLALISLLILAFSRTREAAVIPEQVVVDDEVAPEVDEAELPDEVEEGFTAPPAGTAAGAAKGGAHLRPEEAEMEDAPEPPDDPGTDGQPKPEAGNDR